MMYEEKLAAIDRDDLAEDFKAIFESCKKFEVQGDNYSKDMMFENLKGKIDILNLVGIHFEWRINSNFLAAGFVLDNHYYSL